MTDTDPRLEAVEKAVWWTHGQSAKAVAEQFIRMYDALRTFYQAQRKAAFEAAHPRCPHCGKRGFHMPSCIKSARQLQPEVQIWNTALTSEDAADLAQGADPVTIAGGPIATAPVMGADLPWLDEAAQVASDCYFGWGPSGQCEGWPAVVRAILAYANAQPPSDQEVNVAWDAYASTKGGALDCIRAALIAAAKARSGA